MITDNINIMNIVTVDNSWVASLIAQDNNDQFITYSISVSGTGKEGDIIDNEWLKSQCVKIVNKEKYDNSLDSIRINNFSYTAVLDSTVAYQRLLNKVNKEKNLVIPPITPDGDPEIRTRLIELCEQAYQNICNAYTTTEDFEKSTGWDWGEFTEHIGGYEYESQSWLEGHLKWLREMLNSE